MSQKINLNVAVDKSYEIKVGHVWQKFLDFCSVNYPSRKVFILVDENVHCYHSDIIENKCRQYFGQCHFIQIAAGEQSKSTEVWKRLLDELLENKIERSTPILAVGGGVTGDVAGFAASTVLRGVPLVHMPTSLLAMVDSSIGGKTGVNHPVGKNLIGAFYQPDAVFTNPYFLKTLPEREWINGLSEMLKYAAINSPALFDELEAALNKGFAPSEKWTRLIYKSAQIKSKIVQADAHEQGVRAYLNFGHTFAHALENMAGYGSISHGEAVFAGMLAAAHISENRGGAVQAARFNPFKTLYNINLPSIDKIEALIELMYSDKKVKDETLQLILLNKWGEPYLSKINDDSILLQAWKTIYKELNA